MLSDLGAHVTAVARPTISPVDVRCWILDAAATGAWLMPRSSDIVAMLGTIVQAVRANGQVDGTEPSPFYDSPFYDAYVCANGRFITIGALEPKFYVALLNKLQLNDVDPAAQYDRNQ